MVIEQGRRCGLWRVRRSLRADDEEPEVVSYVNPDMRVIESKGRVALLFRHGSGLWHLYTKKRHARGTLADWTFDDLTPARKGTTSEAQATKWVVDGKWGEP